MREYEARGDKVTICKGGERWDTGLQMGGASEGSPMWRLSLSQLSQVIPQGGPRGQATSYGNLSAGSVRSYDMPHRAPLKWPLSCLLSELLVHDSLFSWPITLLGKKITPSLQTPCFPDSAPGDVSSLHTQQVCISEKEGK